MVHVGAGSLRYFFCTEVLNCRSAWVIILILSSSPSQRQPIPDHPFQKMYPNHIQKAWMWYLLRGKTWHNNLDFFSSQQILHGCPL
ncbi:hypothetical protein GDO81_029983 [Engystomops pustulosus]|uniref:Uncharacterized protein n=1 Tax=Engystomops pustulosus TaxID=76066 RepID=A0AAV6YBD5_ENGPU|nr:hypothetical protein GDO81_029983 [Engystomops pustulosus]